MTRVQERDRLIPVAEIFGPTIAGEGMDAGRRTFFVRVGGCDGLLSGHCTWCDSMHAVDPKVVRMLPRMTQFQIAQRLFALQDAEKTTCSTVTISGGNPALYDLTHLVNSLETFDIWVETQGTIWRPWMSLVNVTVSPKPPSAGRFDANAFDRFLLEMACTRKEWRKGCIKIAVDPGFQDGADLDFAEKIFQTEIEGFGLLDFSLSVVTHPDDSVEDVIDRWWSVVDWAKTAAIPDVRVLPQLHVLLWGHEKGV